jgi:hypothetical protein
MRSMVEDLPDDSPPIMTMRGRLRPLSDPTSIFLTWRRNLPYAESNSLAPRPPLDPETFSTRGPWSELLLPPPPLRRPLLPPPPRPPSSSSSSSETSMHSAEALRCWKNSASAAPRSQSWRQSQSIAHRLDTLVTSWKFLTASVCLALSSSGVGCFGGLAFLAFLAFTPPEGQEPRASALTLVASMRVSYVLWNTIASMMSRVSCLCCGARAATNGMIPQIALPWGRARACCAYRAYHAEA